MDNMLTVVSPLGIGEVRISVVLLSIGHNVLFQVQILVHPTQEA